MIRRFLIFMTMIFLIAAFGCDLSGEKKPYPEQGEDSESNNNSDSSGDESCIDNDGDNWCRGEDCNDYDASIHPGALEQCYDFVDNDCDFQIDQEDSECQDFDDDDFDLLFVF